MTTKVSAFIVGAHSSLVDAVSWELQRCSTVQFGQERALHVFDNEALNWTSPSDLDASSVVASVIEEAFDGFGGLYRVDATAEYWFSDAVIARMAEYNPAAKVIVLLQDPVERAYLAWKIAVEEGLETLSFSEAIRIGRNRFDRRHPTYMYVEHGLYIDHLEILQRHFPTGQVLVLTEQQLREENGFSKICGFLGLNETAIHLEDASVAQMDIVEADRKYLRLMYHPSNQKILEQYGVDLGVIPITHREISFCIPEGFPSVQGILTLHEDLLDVLPKEPDSPILFFPYVVVEDLLMPIINKLRSTVLQKGLPFDYMNVYGSLGTIVEKKVQKWFEKKQMHCERLFLLLSTDMEYPYEVGDETICLRTSLLRYKKRPQDIALPLAWLPWEDAIPSTQRISVGFCGVVNHSKRAELLQFLFMNEKIPTDFIRRESFFGHLRNKRSEQEITRMQEEYQENMKRNLFIACPRGAGNYSIRFYETLRAGRIPVLLDTDMVFPLEDRIDYASIMICEKTPELVEAKILDWIANRDLDAIQKECRRVWEEYLYFPKFLHALPSLLQNLRLV